MNEADVKVGARVKIEIARRHEWHAGAVKALDGKTGTVETVSRLGFLKDGPLHVCVRFDEPAKAWHSSAAPVDAFHFGVADLQAVT